MSKQQKLQLILEKDGSKLWGRVLVNDNVIIDSANSVKALEKKIRVVLKDFEGLDDVQFDHVYDLTVFFKQFNVFNQSKMAELAGINPGLVRQYSSGHKYPSKEQVEKIEKTIRALARKLSTVQLSSKSYA